MFNPSFAFRVDIDIDVDIDLISIYDDDMSTISSLNGSKMSSDKLEKGTRSSLSISTPLPKIARDRSTAEISVTHNSLLDMAFLRNTTSVGGAATSV